ncbi:MAG: hypothetical protein ACI4V7_03375 [Succinivibrionaceae bacterium]
MNFKIYVVFMFVFCIGCLAGCKKNEEVSIYDKDIIGIDENHDGIRDDIVQKMNKEFKGAVTLDEQKVLLDHARNFQEILQVDLNNRTAVLLARTHLDDVMNCAILVFGDGFRYNNYTIMMTQLRQWYFNTPDRKQKHQEFIMRTKEYLYESLPLEGANTCSFEFSEGLKQEIQRRNEEKEKIQKNND